MQSLRNKPERFQNIPRQLMERLIKFDLLLVVGKISRKGTNFSSLRRALLFEFVSMQSLNFHPLLNLLRTGEFSTEELVCFPESSLCMFSKALVTME